MADLTPEQETILSQLSAFTPDNFRRQRWNLIDRARKSGIEWAPIAEALGTPRPGAIRMYRDRPKSGTEN